MAAVILVSHIINKSVTRRQAMRQIETKSTNIKADVPEKSIQVKNY